MVKVVPHKYGDQPQLLIIQVLAFNKNMYNCMSECAMQGIKKNVNNAKYARKKKCLYHPAMECPTPDEPCIFTLIEDMQRKGKNGIDEYL